MAKNQTFSVSLSLLTKNFQKGVKTVQTSLNNLKMQFRNFAAAMGAGLGISEVARNMIDSARKLDKAQAVLKNVSNGVSAYADNQQFVMGLSKKYNQELTTLIANFAKYHATANQANIALDEQQYIFEALTRASAYFNLSADETNGVMLAITQMMSKGRVSSEELRRQLGERLPGAMGLMAKAIGVTNSELENMLKRGQLMAADALPKFARELNNVTQNINVDNIEGATNRLRNAFTNLTTKLNIGDMYKSILNGVSGGLEYVSENLKNVGQTIAITLGTLASKPMIQKAVSAWNTFFNSLEKQTEVQAKKVDRLRERAQLLSKGSGIAIDNKTLQPLAKPVDPNALKSYEKLKFLADDYAEEQKILNAQQDQLNNKIATMGKRIGSAITNILKMAGIQAIYYAIALAISTIITKLTSWYKEQKRIKNIVKDTKEEFDKLSNTLGSQDIELQAAQRNLSVADDDNKRLGIIQKINTLLGLQGDKAFTLKNNNEEINAAIEERLRLLKEEREYQAAKNLLEEKQNAIIEKRKDRDAKQERVNEITEELKDSKYRDWNEELTNEGVALSTERNKLLSQIKNIDTELNNLSTAIEGLNKEIDEGIIGSDERQKILENANISETGTGDIKDEVDEAYKKIQEEYNNTIRALNDRLKDKTIKEDEYDKALEDLTFSTLENIYALNDIDENADPFAKALRDAAVAYLASEKKETEVQKALSDYYSAVQQLYNQYNNGVITHEQLEEALYELLEETVNAVAAMGDLEGAASKLASQFLKDKKERANNKANEIKDPTLGVRDATFDYKKSESDIAGEFADLYRDYESKLQSTIEELEGLDPTDEITQRLEELGIELDKVTAKAKTFEDAMKLAEVSEDVQSLKKEVAEGVWENFSNIADAADRLTRSAKDVIETMEDPDATAWEKILSIFNAVSQTIDTMLQSVQLITTMKETVDKLRTAEQAYQTMQDANASKDLANAAKSVLAGQAEATSSGTAEAAKMPFPYNLLAIAGVVGLIASIFASLPKFAGGGIVQGSSTIGDHNLARVNAGEMILNKQQQATLFGLLNGNTNGAGKNSGQVEFKIRGNELVGVLKNYNNKIKG